MERTAVIDMGSNSWRLVVYGWRRGAWWRLVDEIREPVRVGERLGDELTLKREPMDRALHTAAVFAAFCRAAGVEEIVPVATSAIRDARNRHELLDEIRARTGLEVRVLSGDEEAWYGYLAIANSTTLADGYGIDIGGGSVQLMRIEDRRLAAAASRPLGAVRMTERFIPGDAVKPKQIAALRAHVAGEVRALGLVEAGGGARLAGLGGTIRNLATAAQRGAGHPDTGVQGFRLTAAALGELVDELAARPARKRGGVPGIKPDRADVILAGALVLAAVMEAGEFDAVEVTDAGLREGVFLERYLAGSDPPLVADVRRDAVERLAAVYRPDRRHEHHVGRLSLQLYDGLAAAGLADGTEHDRELLWAAGQLHDIGTAVDYDDHHKHSRYLIRNAVLAGFEPRELVLLAEIARWHRKGEPDAGALGPLARKGDARRLELLAGVVRLAEQLERSRDQSVRAVEVAAEDGRLVVRATAAGDPTVAIWSARRNADLLARAVRRDVEVVQAA